MASWSINTGPARARAPCATSPALIACGRGATVLRPLRQAIRYERRRRAWRQVSEGPDEGAVMPPRAMWKGQLRLSLVTLGVRLYSATESASRVSMNQLHKDCHRRLKQRMVCPEHGEVSRDEIVKGYEYEKDSYVIIDKEELDAIKLETTHTIDLVQFVDPEEIGLLYIDSPYYLGPDGPVAEEAFRVIREAMKRTNKAAIGKLVLQNRERIVAISPKDTGLLLTTLRYAAEVRDSEAYFKDIQNGQVDEEQLEMA
ncbi:MAG: Ku protein, partial [Armatimonadia bacterium]|nr:Ku protein [Armatimonadia bacterium]